MPSFKSSFSSIESAMDCYYDEMNDLDSKFGNTNVDPQVFITKQYQQWVTENQNGPQQPKTQFQTTVVPEHRFMTSMVCYN
eukprot:CFRG4989T1